MTEFSKLHRLLENLIRLGVVAEVQHRPPRVKVRTGSLITAWLPWIAGRAGADQQWDPPTEGEQVLLLSPSGQLANGVAVTGLFSDAIPANGERAGLHRRTYRDGAVIEYDSVAHHLNAVLPNGGTTRLTSTGGIHITGPIFHEGDYTQTGNFTQIGDQQITGEVAVSVDVTAAGVSLVGHPHGGVTKGSDQTGTPEATS